MPQAWRALREKIEGDDPGSYYVLSLRMTLALGRRLAAELEAPALVLLYGELGAGKTTLVKGIVSGLGVANEEEVTSPSFVFVHAYHNHRRVYHVDLYRIEQATELETLGLDDLLAEQAVVLVELGGAAPLAGAATGAAHPSPGAGRGAEVHTGGT